MRDRIQLLYRHSLWEHSLLRHHDNWLTMSIIFYKEMVRQTDLILHGHTYLWPYINLYVCILELQLLMTSINVTQKEEFCITLYIPANAHPTGGSHPQMTPDHIWPPN